MATNALHKKILDELGEDKSLIAAYLLGGRHALEEQENSKQRRFFRSLLFCLGYIPLTIGLYFTRIFPDWFFILSSISIFYIAGLSSYIAFSLKSKEGFWISVFVGLVCLFVGRGVVDIDKEGHFLLDWGHKKIGINQTDSLQIFKDSTIFYRDGFLRIQDSLKKAKAPAKMENPPKMNN